ncbi:MAG: hypothetical protein J7K00_01065 [Candidatus Diapherotrites archaeon]|nr:hypothetical protein [Candidatus Diapherotrites archaeon]
MNIKLHHFAYNTTPNNLELVLELLEKLGCTLAYRKENARWCMIEQKPIPIDIQIIETTDQPISIEKKTNTHIAFLSDTPKEDIEEIKQFLKDKSVKFRQGSWSDKELWFDLPDISVNFAIEIIHTSMVE